MLYYLSGNLEILECYVMAVDLTMTREALPVFLQHNLGQAFDERATLMGLDLRMV